MLLLLFILLSNDLLEPLKLKLVFSRVLFVRFILDVVVRLVVVIGKRVVVVIEVVVVGSRW